MGTMNYNKAIRDKIPEIIEKDGHKCDVRTLSDDEFLLKLEEKLLEELQEYQESKSIEELADILEVIYRISELKGSSKQNLEEIRVKKAENRGKFEKNLFLVESSD
ncbi:phosphoribosyl-ATP pyrophosphohydrolase protein [Marine Group I thaumarchaeote SCGC AAA799-N04]|uniref:Phosphoribosyl-ATP pyrophosphohydrolase protein n=3 Tax=Marine Group I TaxID=905826 RepID=A0A081RMG4_9ARCH|nr:phosphoribosyl-ATP pyrophosphohydrolase protein [Marine Group I thaumarchaeote SCGC AAA799-N04]